MRTIILVMLVVLLGSGLFLAGCSSTGSSVYKIKATNLNQKGQVYFNYGQYAEAIGSYQESLDIDFENSATHYWLGRAYQETADPQKAIEEYRLAVRFTPSMEIAQVALIETLHELGQLDESIIATKSFVKYRTGQADDMVRIGQYFFSQQMDHQAIIVLQRAQELEPTNATPSIVLGDYYQAKGDLEGERGAIMVAFAAEPFYPGLAKRAGLLGIKGVSPRPLPYPNLNPMEQELRAIDDDGKSRVIKH